MNSFFPLQRRMQYCTISQRIFPPKFRRTLYLKSPRRNCVLCYRAKRVCRSTAGAPAGFAGIIMIYGIFFSYQESNQPNQSLCWRKNAQYGECLFHPGRISSQKICFRLPIRNGLSNCCLLCRMPLLLLTFLSKYNL